MRDILERRGEMLLSKLTAKSKLDLEIDNLVTELNECDPYSEQYPKLLRNLDELMKIKKNEKRSISPDTMLVVGGNLLGILMILRHEQLNVITSKALGFVLRGRV